MTSNFATNSRLIGKADNISFAIALIEGTFQDNCPAVMAAPQKPNHPRADHGVGNGPTVETDIVRAGEEILVLESDIARRARDLVGMKDQPVLQVAIG